MGLGFRSVGNPLRRADAMLMASEDLEKLSAFFEEKIDPMDELPYRPGFV